MKKPCDSFSHQRNANKKHTEILSHLRHQANNRYCKDRVVLLSSVGGNVFSATTLDTSKSPQDTKNRSTIQHSYTILGPVSKGI